MVLLYTHFFTGQQLSRAATSASSGHASGATRATVGAGLTIVTHHSQTIQAPAFGKPNATVGEAIWQASRMACSSPTLIVKAVVPSVVNSCMTPQQEAAERDIIFAMITMLRDLRDAGRSDWQTLTSFLANLLMDQDNPPKMLKRLAADVKLKLNMMRQMRTPHQPTLGRPRWPRPSAEDRAYIN
jgi:hypothetical protein